MDRPCSREVEKLAIVGWIFLFLNLNKFLFSFFFLSSSFLRFSFNFLFFSIETNLVYVKARTFFQAEIGGFVHKIVTSLGWDWTLWTLMFSARPNFPSNPITNIKYHLWEYQKVHQRFDPQLVSIYLTCNSTYHQRVHFHIFSCVLYWISCINIYDPNPFSFFLSRPKINLLPEFQSTFIWL